MLLIWIKVQSFEKKKQSNKCVYFRCLLLKLQVYEYRKNVPYISRIGISLDIYIILIMQMDLKA